MILSSSLLSNAARVSTVTARAAISPQPSSQNSGISPIFVAVICASILGTSVISLVVWRRFASGEPVQSGSAGATYYNIPMGRTTNKGVPATRPPEMFDAWTERGRCTSDSVSILKWEEYMPFSVTVLTKAEANSAPVPFRKRGNLWGDRARENGENQDQGNRRLRVGVLVEMPSQPQTKTKTHDGVGQDISTPSRGGLVIGLIEIPWVEGEPSIA